MKKKIFYLLPVLALAACTSNDLTESITSPSNEIRVTTGVGSIAVTRGDGMINSTLAADLDVKAIRVDQTGATPAYPANYTGIAAKSAKVAKTGMAMTFNPAEYYLASGAKTKILAWYPNSGTFDPATSTVKFTGIDGSTDIMATGFAEGDKQTKIAANALTFDHVLTQIAVKVYTPTAAEQTNWGGIESITIKDVKKDVTLALVTPNAASGSYTPSYATVGDMDLVKKDPTVLATGSGTNTTGTNADIKGKDGSTVYSASNELTIPVSTDGTGAIVAGYAMLVPFTYTSPTALKIDVKTKNGGTKTAEIKQSLDKGKAYTVTLKFVAQQIQPTVKISAWEDGGIIDDGDGDGVIEM